MAGVKWCMECGKRFEHDHDEAYCPTCHAELHERIVETGTPLKPRECRPLGPPPARTILLDRDPHSTSTHRTESQRLAAGFRLLRQAGDMNGRD
jgi:transposase